LEALALLPSLRHAGRPPLLTDPSSRLTATGPFDREKGVAPPQPWRAGSPDNLWVVLTIWEQTTAGNRSGQGAGAVPDAWPEPSRVVRTLVTCPNEPASTELVEE